MIVTGCNEANIQWNVNSSIYMCVCILHYAAADEQKLSGMTKFSAVDLILRLSLVLQAGGRDIE